MPEHTIAENLTRLQNAKTAIGTAITAKGGTVAAGDGLEEFAADIATITNQYTAADEGKVVSSGALISQTAYPSTITKNGTYNTTENNSVTVNVNASPSSACAQLYKDNSYTNTERLYISICNGKAIISGRKSVSSNVKTYYINPSDLILSDFFTGNEKTITGYTTYVDLQAAVTCKLYISQNYLTVKCNLSSSSEANYYCDTQ